MATTPPRLDGLLSEVERGVPGGTEIARELGAYLDTKGVTHLLTELTEMLLHRTPANPVQAIIDQLQIDYPDLCVGGPPTALYDASPFGREVTRPGVLEESGSESEEEVDRRKPPPLPDEDVGPDGDPWKPRASVRNDVRRMAITAECIDTEELAAWIAPRVVKGDADMDRIRDMMLRGHCILRELEPELIDPLVQAASLQMVRPGDTIVPQGSEGDAMYLLDHGSVQCVESFKGVGKKKADREMKERQVKMIHAGQAFGQTALMHPMVWPYSVRALGNVRLWVIRRGQLSRVCHSKALKRWSQRQTLVDGCSFLQSLYATERLQVSGALELVDYKDKDVLFRQNNPATYCFFIAHGRVKITQQATPSSAPVVLARLDGGMAVGEAALLYTRPRQATATAVGSVRAYRISRLQFETAVGAAEDILKRNMPAYLAYVTNKL